MKKGQKIFVVTSFCNHFMYHAAVYGGEYINSDSEKHIIVEDENHKPTIHYFEHCHTTEDEAKKKVESFKALVEKRRVQAK
jgi:hypothetical protein